MVPPARVELALPYGNQILSLARLPIPPQGHGGNKQSCDNTYTRSRIKQTHLYGFSRMTSRTLTQLLDDIKGGLRGENISLGSLVEDFHERGFGFFLFLFALPAALPLPGLGINVVIAVPLLLLTAQQAWGRHSVWLPKSIRNQELSRKKLEGFIDAARPWLEKMERFIGPRLDFITRGKASNIIGLLGLIMALAVCVPLPFTNTVPSLGIALMAIGLLMRDGLAVLAGAFIGTAWVSLLVILGHTGMRLLFTTLGL